VEGSLRREAREILAAAGAWLAEFAEEGVESLEVRAPARPAPHAASRPARPEAMASGSPARGEAPAPAATGELFGTPAPAAGPRRTLEEVRAELGECTRCRLHEGRTQIVFGDGHPDADLMFVGEGPGEQEDLRGIPFCGRAGELLTQMIEKGLGLARRDVYICNIVKCRPPGNRTPLADEAATCRPFLDGQIDAVRPKVIVALGKPAASLLLGRDVSITRIRGVWHEYRGIPLMPTFHPAFVLRQYTPEVRRKVWDDLRAALGRVRELAPDPG
jgi:DNA polymerase